MSLMDGTYFVGRKEVLDWINALCGVSLAKVEQTCTGAVACQILDALYPGRVQMSKVDWAATKDYEYIQNYKVLQKAFVQLKIDKHVEVDRLVRGKYQDNLEFMQWFKAFYERNASGAPYDAVAQREKGKGGAQFTQKFGGRSAAAAAPVRRKVGAAATTARASAKASSGGSVAASARSAKTSMGASRRLVGSTGSVVCSAADMAAAVTAATEPLEKELEDLTAVNKDLMRESGELRAMVRALLVACRTVVRSWAYWLAVAGQVESLEKERDFYFHKLREVEVMLQSTDESETNPLVQDVFKILYATEEDGPENEQVAGEVLDEQM